MRRILVSGLVAVVGVALWLVPARATGKSSSNGEAAKSATTILADAKAATGASTAVAISGTIISGRKRVSVNIVSAHGAGGGTITTGGGTIHIVLATPNIYVNADKASWTRLTGSATAGQRFAGKWIQTTTADKNFASLASTLDAATFAQLLTPTTVTKGAVTTFHGKKAVPLKDRKGGTLYVAATGSPYILGIVGKGAKHGQVLFTQYGTAKVPNAPSNAISLSQLEQTTSGSQ